MTITIYSQPNCFPCRAVKKYLTDRDIPYIELDARNHVEYLKTTGHKQSPVVVHDGGDFSGYNVTELAKLAG